MAIFSFKFNLAKFSIIYIFLSYSFHTFTGNITYAFPVAYHVVQGYAAQVFDNDNHSTHLCFIPSVGDKILIPCNLSFMPPYGISDDMPSYSSYYRSEYDNVPGITLVSNANPMGRFNIHFYLDHMWHLNIGFNK